MAKSIEVVINDAKLQAAVDNAEGLGSKLNVVTQATVSNANLSSAGYRTGIFHRKDGTKVGNTQPKYGGDVQRGSKGYIGIVHPLNYAAMKDNYENNTMLKAIRSVGNV